MKTTLKILLGLLVFLFMVRKIRCYEGIILKPEKRERILKAIELPMEIESKFKELKNTDVWLDNYFTNLDSSAVTATDKSLSTGPWSNGHQFTIGNIKYHMKWNGNRECPPFILKDKKLYYKIVNYGEDRKDYMEYGVINLEKELKY